MAELPTAAQIAAITDIAGDLAWMGLDEAVGERLMGKKGQV